MQPLDNNTSNLTYRKDVEGLRAIAILLVIAAHAEVPGLAGGFVGVDVFFVLSGYLITALLTQEISGNGRINFLAFYARRFRRLLPALLLMLAGTGLAALALLPPDEHIPQAISALSATLWLSNFHFAFSDLNYFDTSSANNLFLHTWSLGVEEQFYLLWPLLLAAVLGTSYTPDTKAPMRRLKWVMLAVLLPSLTACFLLTTLAPAQAFYMMPARAWEFALGALMWLHAHPARLTTASTSTLRAAGWLGLAMIGLAALTLDDKTPYPGLWALLPSVGTALMLAAGAIQSRNGATRLLSIAPLQAIGRVSYSWYLWHWPVLLLGAELLAQKNLSTRLLLALIALLIAGASYRLIENPIRRNPRLAARPDVTLFCALLLMAAASTLTLSWIDKVSAWLDTPEQQRYASARFDTPLIYAMGCDDWHHSADVEVCSFGQKNAEHTALIIGDSIGLQWFPAINKVFEKPNWRLLVITKSSCPMVDESYFYKRIGRPYEECSQWRKRAVDEIVKIKPEVLLIGSTASYEFSRAQWIQGTQRILARLSPQVQDLYLIRATPSLPFDGPNCLSNAGRRSPMQITHKQHCTAPAASVQNTEVWAWLGVAAKPFSNLHMVDMNESVCPRGACSAEQGDHIVFRDNQHLSASYAASLAKPLSEKLRMEPNPSPQAETLH